MLTSLHTGTEIMRTAIETAAWVASASLVALGMLVLSFSVTVPCLIRSDCPGPSLFRFTGFVLVTGGAVLAIRLLVGKLRVHAAEPRT